MATREVLLRPRARLDVLERAAYSAEHGSGHLVARFVDAVGETAGLLSEMPGVGRRENFVNPALSDLRSWPARGFPAIRVYYFVFDDHIRVLRVLDSRMDVESLMDSEP